MTLADETANFEALRDVATNRLLALGALASELPTARAHLLGGKVAWYFGDRTRTGAQWLLADPLFDSGKIAEMQGKAQEFAKTKLEWYAALLAVLNSLLDADTESTEWWLFREQANALKNGIQEIENQRRVNRQTGRLNKGREGPTKKAIRQIAAHIGKLSAEDIIKAMRDDELMADMYGSTTDPLPIEVIEVNYVGGRVHYRARKTGKPGKLDFGTIQNKVAQIRNSNPARPI